MSDELALTPMEVQQFEEEERLNRLAVKTAYKVGEDFFAEVVTALAEILGVGCVMINECLGQQARSLAWYKGNQLCDNIEYDLDGTPSEVVLEQGIFFCPRDVQKAFSSDEDLAWFGAESYGGVSLTDSQGNAVGLLCYLHDREIPDSKWKIPSLKVIQARCGAEIERLRNERIRVQEQQAIEESKRLASLGTLAAGIAHEINNPLTTIQLLVELALHESQKESMVPRKNLEMIMQSVESITHIVDSVLRVSNNQDTEKTICDLKGIVRRACDCTSHVSRGASIRVAFDDAGVCLVLGNSLELQQVFVNLISNAIQATQRAGFIDEVQISVTQDLQSYCVSIRNQGHAISADELNRIFDPFYTSRASEGGTGLGLSVSLGIVKAHGGEISVNSTAEVTEFVVRLPLSHEETRV